MLILPRSSSVTPESKQAYYGTVEGVLIIDTKKIHSGTFELYYDSRNNSTRINWINGTKEINQNSLVVSNSIANSKAIKSENDIYLMFTFIILFVAMFFCLFKDIDDKAL